MVLPQFFSDTQFVVDEDIVAMVGKVDCPQEIDSIWCAYHEWRDETEYEIGWKKVL